MLTRLFPYLQPEPNAFGPEWERKRAVLDDSFRFLIEMQAKHGNTVSGAFTAMIDKKFNFKNSFCYTEYKPQ